jgi:hypothetical protein
VVLVYGPGGIGKSTFLRQVADRGREAGWTPVMVEGRELPPVPHAIEEALVAAPSSVWRAPGGTRIRNQSSRASFRQDRVLVSDQ